jgi:TPR repeat protein
MNKAVTAGLAVWLCACASAETSRPWTKGPSVTAPPAGSPQPAPSEAEREYQIGLDLFRNAGRSRVNRDSGYAEAANHFRVAAERGHPGAQYELGILYFNGIGVSQDRREARRWLEESAAQGNPQARSALATFAY